MATASAALSVAAAAAAAVGDDRATPSDTERLARSSLTASLTRLFFFLPLLFLWSLWSLQNLRFADALAAAALSAALHTEGALLEGKSPHE